MTDSEQRGVEQAIDIFLNERLTNDKTADVLLENYKGLLVAGVDRDTDYERYIKLARLENLYTAKAVRAEKYFYGLNYYCPTCGNLLYHTVPAFCDRCGQRLKE